MKNIKGKLYGAVSSKTRARNGELAQPTRGVAVQSDTLVAYIIYILVTLAGVRVRACIIRPVLLWSCVMMSVWYTRDTLELCLPQQLLAASAASSPPHPPLPPSPPPFGGWRLVGNP